MIGEEKISDPNNPTPQVDVGTAQYGENFDSVLDIVWKGMRETGFSGSRGQFFTLLCTDPEVLDLSFDLMSSTGFEGTKDELAGLLGVKDPEPVKKKEDTDLQLEDTSSELPKIEVPEVKTGRVGLTTDIVNPEDEVYNKAGRGEDFINFFSSNIDAGLAQGNSVSEVVELMTQGKNFTQEDVDDLIESAKQMENLPPSEEMIKFTKAVQDNGGDNFAFLKTLADFDDDVNSYKVLAETGIRSFVGMGKAAYEEPLLTAGGGVLGSAVGPTGTVVGAMSAAGGLMETSVSFIEFLKEELGEKDFNRENVTAILNDDEKRKSIRNRALVRGGTTALFDLIGGAVATKAAGAVAKVAKKTTTGLGKTLGTTGAVGTAGVVEGVFGGAGEATARLAAGQEYSAIETGLEAFGGSAKGIITGPLGIVKTSLENTPYYKRLSKGIASYELNGKIVNKKDIEEFIDSSTPEEVDMFLKKTNLVINNDNELSNKIENKRKRFKISKDVVSDPNGKNTEKIIDLEVELDGLKDNKTESGKNKRNQIKEEIKKLQTAEDTVVQDEVSEVSETQKEGQVKLIEEDGSDFITPEGSNIFEIGSKKQTVAVVDGKGRLIASFDSKTRKKRKTNTLAEKELIQEYDYTKGKKAVEVDPEGAKNPNLKLDEFIAEKSENAQEIAQALQRESKVDTSQTVDPIFEYIAGTKIDPKQFFERTGYKRKDIPVEVQRSWFKKGGQTLDQLAQGVEMDGGMNVTLDELVQIILDNPSNRIKKKTRTYDALLNKFKNLTGFTGSTKTIDAVANQDPSQLKSEVPQEVVEEQGKEREVAEKTIEKEDQANEQQENQQELFDDSEKPESIDVLDTHMDAADKKLKKASLLKRAKDFAGKLPKVLKRQLIDRQADLKRILTNISDTKSIRALNLLITKAGSGALASQIFKGFESKIYKGLKSVETKALDSIIYARRIISINENRRQRRAKSAEYEAQYGSEITPEQAKNIDDEILDFYYEENEDTGVYEIRDFSPYEVTTEGKTINENVANESLEQLKQRIGEEQYNKLFDRSEAYFESTKSLLERLYDSGRITKAQFDYFKDINYSPFRVIEKIFPESGKDLSSLTEKEEADFLRVNGIPAKDIMALKDGGEYTVMKDSKQLLAMYSAAVARRSFHNKFMNAFFDVYTKHAQNETIQEHMTTDPKVAAEKGFVPMGFFKDGKRTMLYVDETTAKQMLDLRGDTKLLDIAGTFSGAKLIRFFATGANPFFIVSNVPMDFVNVAFFTDAYNRGIEKFKPVAMFKLARDFSLNLAGKIKSDLTGSGKFKEALEEAIEHGMGFDFLSQEGKSKRVGSKKIGSKVVDFLSYAGVASEQAMRLSVYLKVKKDKIADYRKENGVEPTGQALEDIKFSSAAEARETIDFSQGGSLVKDLDKVAPYLNATFQGFRRPFKYYSENRLGFISNVVQATFLASSVPLANGLMAGLFFEDEEKDDVLRKLREETTPYERTNYFLLIDPRNPKNENGDINYIRIRKLPTIAPIAYLGEEMIHSYQSGKDFSFDDFSKTIEAAAPVSGSLVDNIGYNPGISAIAALNNYDLYRRQEIFRKNDNALINENAEGLYDKDVATLYKYFGFGGLDVVSPKRMQVAVEKFITSPSTNPLVGAGYASIETLSNLYKGGADVEPVKEGFKSFFEGIAKSSSRRMFRSTNPRVKDYATREKLEEDIKNVNTEIYLKESKVKNLISEYKEENKIEDRNPKIVPEKINKFINENFDSPEERRRMKRKTLRKIQLPSVSSIYFDLVFEKNSKSQGLILRAIYGEQIDKEEMNEVNKLSKLIMGRSLGKSAFREYKKLIIEGKK